MSNQPPPLGSTLVLHELVALFERLPRERRTEAARALLDACHQLDEADVDPFTTVQAGAQITIKAFSQFAR